jgi:hypothetical protein
MNTNDTFKNLAKSYINGTPGSKQVKEACDALLAMGADIYYDHNHKSIDIGSNKLGWVTQVMER